MEEKKYSTAKKPIGDSVLAEGEGTKFDLTLKIGAPSWRIRAPHHSTCRTKAGRNNKTLPVVLSCVQSSGFSIRYNIKLGQSETNVRDGMVINEPVLHRYMANGQAGWPVNESFATINVAL